MRSADAAAADESASKKDRHTDHAAAPLLSLSPSITLKLNEIELQLVLQILGSRSKLVAGRTCRLMQRMVWKDVSWKHADAIPLRNLQALLAIPASFSTLAPFSLSLLSVDTLPAALPPITPVRLVKLDATNYASTSQLLRILRLPPFAQLRHLLLPDVSLCSELIVALSRLQALRHLHMSVCIQSNPAEQFAPLSQLESLTSLELTLSDEEQWYTMVDGLLHVIRPLRLQHLTLRNAEFRPSGFRILATAPFNQLQSLRLICCQTDTTGLREDPSSPVVAAKEDYAAVFAAMRSLDTLELRDVCHAELLISQLHHASALRTLRVGALRWDRQFLPPPFLEAVLRALTTAAPLLRVRLHCVSEERAAICAERSLLLLPHVEAPPRALRFPSLHALLHIPRVELDDVPVQH